MESYSELGNCGTGRRIQAHHGECRPVISVADGNPLPSLIVCITLAAGLMGYNSFISSQLKLPS